MRSFVAAILLSAFAAQVFPRTAAEWRSQVQTSLTARGYEAATVDLQSFKGEQPNVFALNNFDYLLGRTLEKLHDTSGAMQSYETVIAGNSVLKNYALWHLSTLARGSGNLFLERIYLREVAAFGGPGTVTEAAGWRLAESYLDSGDYTSALRHLATPQSNAGDRGPPNNDRSRKRRALIGRANMLAGNIDAARNLFEGLVGGTPDSDQPDDYALAAVIGLDAIDTAAATELPDSEDFRRAGVYHFNREFNSARKHYLAVLNRNTNVELMPKAVFETGRTFAQEGNFSEAVKWFERERDPGGDPRVVKDSLLQAASAYARLGKTREAITRYRNYIAKYPDDERIDRAYLNIIDVSRDQGEETSAIQVAQEAQNLFRGKTPEALALFSESRIYIARNDWERAVASLDKLRTLPNLGGASVPGGTSIAEIDFLRGYALERLGRFAAAIDAYLSIPDGRNEYYGWRATERLRAISLQEEAKPSVDAKLNEILNSDTRDVGRRRRNALAAVRLTADEAMRKKLVEILRLEYARMPQYDTAPKGKVPEVGRTEIFASPREAGLSSNRSVLDELIFLGLYDEAALEVEANAKAAISKNYLSSTMPPRTKMSNESAYAFTDLFARGDRADRSFALAQRFLDIPADYPVELLDSKFAQYLYPAPYKDALIANTERRGVDPRFLLAIIRQESGFRPYVKSNAAARGLMQFISGTASATARELGISDFQNDDLFDPETSILIGSKYAEKLFSIFPEQPEAVAAAYNGGDDNMRRWLTRSKSRDADRYVAEIAYGQSKEYVYRVMSNYRVYRLLYDAALNLKAVPTDPK